MLQTSQFHCTDSSRNSWRHTLLALHYPASWNVLLLPLSLYWISHTCSHSTRLLSCIVLLHSRHSFVYLLSFPVCLKAFFFISSSHNDRIPNWDLALPYQEARTSLTQTTGIPLWWCQTCYQMDQPWDDCCKLTTIALM